MLFRRRVRPDFATRLLGAAWPPRTWSRSLRYIAKRVLRISATPHAIAAGVAAGTFAAFTPFIGFHFFIGFAIAFLIGGNLVAAAAGTALGNPLTFPLIWASTYEVGKAILGLRGHVAAVGELTGNFAARSFETLMPLIRPMMIGSIPLGLLAAVVLYVVVFHTARGVQSIRRARLALRREAGRAAMKGDDPE